MTDIKLGQRVYVGGAVGTIVSIGQGEISVTGEYTYSSGSDEPGFVEPWTFRYTVESFQNLTWDSEFEFWNAAGLIPLT